MVRYIGIYILLVASWAFSAELVRRHKRTLEELKALTDMISYVRDNIEYRMKPLPDIFNSYTEPYLEECGLLPAVRQTDLRQAWDKHTFSLTGEAYELVRDFVHEIGSGYRTEELRLCEYTLERLGGILDHARSESSDRQKLYRTVPIMFALSVILILL